MGQACSLVFLGAPPPEPLSGELGEPDRQVLGQFALDRYRPPAPVEFGVDDVTANPGDIALVLVDEGLAAGDQRNRPMPGRKRPVVAAQRR